MFIYLWSVLACFFHASPYLPITPITLEGWECGNFDLPGFTQGLVSLQRGASVDQEFQLSLSKNDYKKQLRQFQREEIRDLFELTTDRMDMYRARGKLRGVQAFFRTFLILLGLRRSK